MLKRTDESGFTSWWFEIDRKLLIMILVLIGVGLFAAYSVGSVSAARTGLPWFYYIKKSLIFLIPALTILIGSSFLTKKQVFWVAVANAAFAFLLFSKSIVAPDIINGVKRWVIIGGFKIMPADILKPGFVILTAWFLAKMKENFGQNIFTNKEAWKLQWMSWLTYLGCFTITLLLILTRPDLGTGILYLGIFTAMVFVAGLPKSWLMGFFAVGAGIIGLAYTVVEYIRDRIHSFLGQGDNFQVQNSIDSIKHGGLFGGGDDAFVKQSLPDSHTDFVFAGIVEDVGAILGTLLLIALLYVMVLLVRNAKQARDNFVFYAVSGASALFGLQAMINLGATLGLTPAKGMTLPFVSYGGSSLLGFCLLFGMILAIVREDKWK